MRLVTLTCLVMDLSLLRSHEHNGFKFNVCSFLQMEDGFECMNCFN